MRLIDVCWLTEEMFSAPRRSERTFRVASFGALPTSELCQCVQGRAVVSDPIENIG
jgi:hypothetical protein